MTLTLKDAAIVAKERQTMESNVASARSAAARRGGIAKFKESVDKYKASCEQKGVIWSDEVSDPNLCRTGEPESCAIIIKMLKLKISTTGKKAVILERLNTAIAEEAVTKSSANENLMCDTDNEN